MLGILPEAYLGESVYGIVSRYHRQWTATTCVPGRTNSWLGLQRASRFGLCSAPNVVAMGYYTQPRKFLQALLTEHSLLSDSCVFFGFTSRQQALARLIERNVSASDKVATWLTLPLATRTLAAGLRYCRACAEEDVRLVGEPYWHVAHQGQATAICLRHGEWLMTLSGVDGHLIAGPAVAHGLEVHPMGGGKIPPIVRDLATL